MKNKILIGNNNNLMKMSLDYIKLYNMDARI